MENLTIADVVEVLVVLTGAIGTALCLYAATPYLTESGVRRQFEHAAPAIRMAAVGLVLIVVAFGIVEPAITPRCPSPTGGGSETTAARAGHTSPLVVHHPADRERRTPSALSLTASGAQTNGTPDEEGGTTWD
ncbi:MAG: hypothetical protein OXE50_01805 [Chloroflexi bacterium]|nr:hypothetical protein [Chloroflexota bacterium]